MGQTLYFLTATWIAAQGVDTTVYPQSGVQQTGCNCGAAVSHVSPVSMRAPRHRVRRGFFAKMGARCRRLFRGQHRAMKRGCSTCGHNSAFSVEPAVSSVASGGCNSCGAGFARGTRLHPSVTMQPSHIPVNVSEPPLADSGIVTKTNFSDESVVSNASLSSSRVHRVGHEDDYSWVTGELSKVDGKWVIVYDVPNSDDLFGGRFVLNTNADMSKFAEGNLVSVHGQPIYGDNGIVRPASYRAETIDLIEQ